MDKYLIGQKFPIPLVTDEVPEGKAVTVTIDAVRVFPESTTPPTFIDTFAVATNPTGRIVLSIDPANVGRRSVWRFNWTIADDTGVLHDYTQDIQIEATETLVKGENSFQSYYSAMMYAEEMPGVDAFKNATKEEQIAALINAYRSISTMTFGDRCHIYYDIASLNAEELDKLSPALLEALCLAQVIEANESLDINSVHYKRMDGLMSETIGESSMMFRPGKVANNTVVTKRSMGFLRNFLVITARITRA